MKTAAEEQGSSLLDTCVVGRESCFGGALWAAATEKRLLLGG